MAEWQTYDEYRSFQVAGTSHYNENVERFIAGDCKSLEVKHEPREGFPHALAVYGIWVEEDSSGSDDFKDKRLGYVPDWLAKEVFPVAAKLGLADGKCRIVPVIFELDTSQNRIKIELELQYKSQ